MWIAQTILFRDGRVGHVLKFSCIRRDTQVWWAWLPSLTKIVLLLYGIQMLSKNTLE